MRCDWKSSINRHIKASVKKYKMTCHRVGITSLPVLPVCCREYSRV